MSVILDITEGWTAELGPFTLRVNGAPLDLSGLSTPVVVLHNARGRTVTPGGTLRVDAVPSTGKVYYTPVAADFVFDDTLHATRQSYTIHFKITDGAGKVVFFPNAEASEIGVYKA